VPAEANNEPARRAQFRKRRSACETFDTGLNERRHAWRVEPQVMLKSSA